MKKARVFEPSEDLPKDRSSLLTVSNKFGLTFVGLDRTFKVYLTRDILAADRFDGNSNEIGMSVTVQVWIWICIYSGLHHLQMTHLQLHFHSCIFLIIDSYFPLCPSGWDSSVGGGDCGTCSAPLGPQLWWTHSVSMWPVWGGRFVPHLLWRPHLHEQGDCFSQWIYCSSVSDIVSCLFQVRPVYVGILV